MDFTHEFLPFALFLGALCMLLFKSWRQFTGKSACKNCPFANECDHKQNLNRKSGITDYCDCDDYEKRQGSCNAPSNDTKI